MPYPIMNKAEARSYLLAADAARSSEEEHEDPIVPETRYTDDGSDEDWEALGLSVAARLLALAETNKNESGEIKGGDFEAAAGPEIHRLLPVHPALADAEFWVWLAITHCQEIVDRRYPGKRNLKNFGIGGASENLLYRLWLRAEIARDADAKDEYARARIGDIDFWRSHVFRQGYGDVRTFTHALIDFQFPEASGRKARLKIDEIRSLAKRLKRARSNLMFEVMTGERAALFIKSEWERLAEEAL
jgi:hypothetical protein